MVHLSRRLESLQHADMLSAMLQGLQRALEAGAEEVAIFAAASETFSRRNTNCSIDESLKRFADICQAAKEARVQVRGYVSCAVGCPYEVSGPSQASGMIARRILSLASVADGSEGAA